MLKNLIENRYSARIWNNTDVCFNKVDYILDCAYNAPSKQSLYPYKITALTNSSKAKKFKENLFWNDTWCVDGRRAEEKDKGSQDKRFNGQYRAPLVLVWSHRIPDEEKFQGTTAWHFYKDCPWEMEQNIVDMTVSSSFAMLAAEEQGLSTCFGRCHSEVFEDTILGKGTVHVGIVLGIGYATPELEEQNRMLEPIYSNSRLEGYDTKNLPKSFPTSKHSYRSRKPSFRQIVDIV